MSNSFVIKTFYFEFYWLQKNFSAHFYIKYTSSNSEDFSYRGLRFQNCITSYFVFRILLLAGILNLLLELSTGRKIISEYLFVRREVFIWKTTSWFDNYVYHYAKVNIYFNITLHVIIIVQLVPHNVNNLALVLMPYITSDKRWKKSGVISRKDRQIWYIKDAAWLCEKKKAYMIMRLGDNTLMILTPASVTWKNLESFHLYPLLL